MPSSTVPASTEVIHAGEGADVAGRTERQSRGATCGGRSRSHSSMSTLIMLLETETLAVGRRKDALHAVGLEFVDLGGTMTPPPPP